MTDSLAPRLQPASAGELLDQAFTIYRRNIVLLVGTAIVPTVLVGMFQIYVAQHVNLALIGILVALVGKALVAGGLVVIAASATMAETVTLPGALRACGRHFGPALAAYIGAGFMITLGFLMLIVPGMYWMATYAVAVPVAVMENPGMAPSLKRSRALVDGFRWRMLLIFLVVMTLSISLIIGLGMLAKALGHGTDGKAWYVGLLAPSPLISVPISLLIEPLQVVMLTRFYFDLRVRKEALDIGMMMEKAEAAEANAAGGGAGAN